jgi:hypothetical protein
MKQIMQWKAFKDELPEENRLILFGNHRFVEVCLYDGKHYKIQQSKLNYKNVTHWCYIESPPVVAWESEWIKPSS